MRLDTVPSLGGVILDIAERHYAVFFFSLSLSPVRSNKVQNKHAGRKEALYMFDERLVSFTIVLVIQETCFPMFSAVRQACPEKGRLWNVPA